MLSEIKNLVVLVLAAVIGAIISAWLLTPDTEGSQISAEATWIRVPLNDKNVDYDGIISEGEKISKLINVPKLAAFIQNIRFSSQQYLTELSLQNTGDKRLTNIELDVQGLHAVAFGSDDPNPNPSNGLFIPSGNSISIPVLNPRGQTSLLILSDQYYDADKAIELMVGGQRVPIHFNRLSGLDTIGITALIAHHAPLSEFLIIILVGMGSILVLALPFAIYATSSNEARYKTSSKSELKKLEKFINWVRQHHPDAFE